MSPLVPNSTSTPSIPGSERTRASAPHGCASAPPSSGSATLRPSNARGALEVGTLTLITAGAGVLASRPDVWLWMAGELFLALAMVKWFVVLHEAGHGTLMRSRRAQLYVGHLASFFAVIPFLPWRVVHREHHRWTGWQDIDPTTASLVPRARSRLERMVMNACWRLWLPLFSIVYRAGIFWNLRLLRRRFPTRRRSLIANAAVLAAGYLVVVALLGARGFAQGVLPALFLSLAFLEPLMLSQHTHLPQRLSGGERAAPVPAREQWRFTRSLRFPSWFSRVVLLHFDAHELHHMYPWVPGYRLGRLGLSTPNTHPAWEWIRRAKQLPAEVFLFQHRDQTGANL